MVKFINTAFLILILLSCKKEQVDLPVYLDADISFLYGEWKWNELELATSQTTPKIFLKASNEPQIECAIFFDAANQLKIVSSSGESTMKLHLTGVDGIENIKIISFRTADDQLIRFTYFQNLNLLTTEKKLFDIPVLPCFSTHKILNTTYEKV